MNNIDDKILLQRIANSDEDAFRAIFMKYKARFFAAALKMTHSADLSEEIVQEVFVTLWLRRENLASVESPASYLFTIVHNSILFHFKKMAKEALVKRRYSEEIIKNECQFEDLMEERENEELLNRIIQQLPSQQKLVYQLNKIEGLTRDEIAERLQLSPNTVKNHLLKAMKYLRGSLSKAYGIFITLFL